MCLRGSKLRNGASNCTIRACSSIVVENTASWMGQSIFIFMHFVDFAIDKFPSHYFYRLRSEYAIPRTPRSGKGWGFRSVTRHVSAEEREGQRTLGFYPGGVKSGLTSKRNKKRLVLSQTMIMDMDPNKVRNGSGYRGLGKYSFTSS